MFTQRDQQLATLFEWRQARDAHMTVTACMRSGPAPCIAARPGTASTGLVGSPLGGQGAAQPLRLAPRGLRMLLTLGMMPPTPGMRLPTTCVMLLLWKGSNAGRCTTTGSNVAPVLASTPCASARRPRRNGRGRGRALPRARTAGQAPQEARRLRQGGVSNVMHCGRMPGCAERAHVQAVRADAAAASAAWGRARVAACLGSGVGVRGPGGQGRGAHGGGERGRVGGQPRVRCARARPPHRVSTQERRSAEVLGN